MTRHRETEQAVLVGEEVIQPKAGAGELGRDRVAG